MSYLDQILSGAEQLGLSQVFAQSRAYLARAESLGERHTELGRAAQRDHASVVDALVTGREVPAGDVVRAAAELACWSGNGPGALVYTSAIGECQTRAATAARAAGPALFAELVRVVGEAVTESMTLVRQVPDYVVDERSARVSPLVFESWVKLTAANTRWCQAHSLAGVLRVAQWVASYPTHRFRGVDGDQGELYVRYADPERLRSGYWALVPERKLAAAVAAGAGPGLFDGAEALARRRGRRAADEAAKMRRPVAARMVEVAG